MINFLEMNSFMLLYNIDYLHSLVADSSNYNSCDFVDDKYIRYLPVMLKLLNISIR